MNTQVVPPAGPLIAQMPSGRVLYEIEPYLAPRIDGGALQTMVKAPDRADIPPAELSSDDEFSFKPAPVGTFPNTSEDYSRSSSTTAYY